MRRTPARLLVLLAGIVAVLALAGPAVAHVGGDVAGSDFDGRVTSVTPEVPGVTVRVLQFGDEFEVVNTTGTDVEVPGYSDEPYLRIGPDGVWRNSRSPATYLNLDRFGRADVPDSVDVDAEPDWVQVSTEPRVRLARPPHALDERGPAAAGGRGRPRPRAPGRRLGGADDPRRDRGGGGRRAHLGAAALAVGGVAGAPRGRRPRPGRRPARPGRAAAGRGDAAGRRRGAGARAHHPRAAGEHLLARRRDRLRAAAGPGGGARRRARCPGGVARARGDGRPVRRRPGLAAAGAGPARRRRACGARTCSPPARTCWRASSWRCSSASAPGWCPAASRRSAGSARRPPRDRAGSGTCRRSA